MDDGNTKNRAVFLDRDGTINVDKGYLYKIEDFEFIDGAIEAIKKLNDHGFKVIVITNQAGIGRRYYTEEDVETLHRYINRELARHQAHIDAFYFCPHHPTEAIGRYKESCNCRKPKTGLFEKAIAEFDIEAEKSYVIGDKIIDIEAGKRIGAKTILLGNKLGQGIECNFVAEDLLKAVELLLPAFS